MKCKACSYTPEHGLAVAIGRTAFRRHRPKAVEVVGGSTILIGGIRLPVVLST